MDLLDLLLHPTKAGQRYSPLTEGLTEGQARELRWIFSRVREGEHRARVQGERSYASQDAAVRHAYSKDASTLPKAIDQLIKRVPGAVVLPTTEAQLHELLDFAQNNSVPITPRGGGTQPYGGAVPTEGGVVADMRAFDEVLDVDAAKKEVRVQAGANWHDLEARLNEEDLSLRAEPLTAPFSTVGGWIATGGGGFGSHQYGTIRDIVTEVTVLTPDGERETWTGKDLDLAVGAHGATGVLLDAGIKVRDPAETGAA
ncbi:MAG: FAD-dependent oxidoreductase, partial [Candidatus Thermoplasmatota archaeon]|nr:FAD-dependent oxidoreductase [Candidatus Thermoplasmatota archaeon]